MCLLQSVSHNFHRSDWWCWSGLHVDDQEVCTQGNSEGWQQVTPIVLQIFSRVRSLTLRVGTKSLWASLSLSLSLSRHLVLTGLTKNAGAWQFSFLRCDYSKGVTHNNFLARTKKDPAGQAERMWCNLTFSLHFLYIVKLGNWLENAVSHFCIHLWNRAIWIIFWQDVNDMIKSCYNSANSSSTKLL